jgi:putative DNA primase/helicase
MNPVADFTAAIEAAGLGAPAVIADGAIHRFHCADDKPGTKNGWYILHLSGTPAGCFGSWKTGITETWCSISRDEQTPAQRAELRRLVEQAKRQRDAEQRERNAKAAAWGAQILEHARPADPSHPYLVAKEIAPHGIRQRGGSLLVPVYVDGELSSLQAIARTGSKRFLPGGRISGGFYRIDDQTRRDEVLVCEGFATGASLHEETGCACYVAFNAGNLSPVARSVRQRHRSAKIVICGDNDAWTPGNPGHAKARRAALETGSLLSIPRFDGLDTTTRPSDWNDWYRLRRAAQGRAVQ